MNERSGRLYLMAVHQTAVVFLMTAVVFAQTTPGKLAFEVATVRPSAPLDMQKLAAEIQAGKMPRLGAHVDAARAEYFYFPLRNLIAYAYNVKAYQVMGPAWMATERFDIEAKIPDGVAKDNAPAMMQELLEDRFGLKVHRDTHEREVWALVVGKGGPKLKDSAAVPESIDPNAPLKPGQTKIEGPNGPMLITRKSDGSVTMNMGKRGIITQRFDPQSRTMQIESSTMTMAGFADVLTKLLQMGGDNRQAVDMTGLKGNYQVAVEISLAEITAVARNQGFATPPTGAAGDVAPNALPAMAASDPGGGTSVFSSVAKLGLKLEERKAPVEQIVVDQVNKTPTPN
ncbi:MAG: TIGR03435 family protein [Acidobacteriota bacterium]